MPCILYWSSREHIVSFRRVSHLILVTPGIQKRETHIKNLAKQNHPIIKYHKGYLSKSHTAINFPTAPSYKPLESQGPSAGYSSSHHPKSGLCNQTPTARFGFHVRGAILKSEDLGHALAQVGGRRVVRMHPVLGTHCVAVLWGFHLLKKKEGI